MQKGSPPQLQQAPRPPQVAAPPPPRPPGPPKGPPPGAGPVGRGLPKCAVTGGKQPCQP